MITKSKTRERKRKGEGWGRVVVSIDYLLLAVSPEKSKICVTF